MDKRNITPLYYQLIEKIETWIREGVYKEDEKIPSENELVSQFSISKITVNKALSELVTRGILYRIQGKGTYVAKKKYARATESLISFTKEHEDKGLRLDTEIIENSILSDPNIATQLHLHTHQEIRKCARLRYVEGEPIAYQISYLDASKTKDVNFEKSKSLYMELKQIGILMMTATENYSVVRIQDKQIAEYLKVNLLDPVYYVTRYSYDEKHDLIEYATSYLRSDRYNIEVRISAEREGETYGKETDLSH